MIQSGEDLESELDRLGRKYERIGDGTLLVSVPQIPEPSL